MVLISSELACALEELVDAWDPQAECQPKSSELTAQFCKALGASDYFLDSADRIHFFIEKDAEDEDGKIKKSVSKARSLNKVGHGLHVADPLFREYSQSSKVAELVAELGWRDPVLPQSMYIFKQPATGSEVTSHQDSSFLYTTPRPTCMGLWLALDDATLENGCLWARPGSHKEAVRRIFARVSEDGAGTFEGLFHLGVILLAVSSSYGQ
ncbi:Phyhd1 [Symbiodinium necroappetens]|uniref:Phyhd1 protein n=1 Tax=Symbiodinium necroappetens TaxID=1628268 RepID=A0A813A140_9DINO|nr:Phyhd1 [Symbiodinium necroappetens]